MNLVEPKCPYCMIYLKKIPERKSRCKSCGEYIYPRVKRLDDDQYTALLKEEDLPLYELEKQNEFRNSYRDELFKKLQGILDLSEKISSIELTLLGLEYEDTGELFDKPILIGLDNGEFYIDFDSGKKENTLETLMSLEEIEKKAIEKLLGYKNNWRFYYNNYYEIQAKLKKRKA